jgi:hypothetical protein
MKSELDIINCQGSKIVKLETEILRLNGVVKEKEAIIQRIHAKSRDHINLIADMASLVEAAQSILKTPGAEEMLRKVRVGEVL